jgi:hypothetical protein
MMRLVDDERISATLASCFGRGAKLWMYHVSHQRFAIMLAGPDPQVTFYLVAYGCESIRGKFRWDKSNLSITHRDGRCVVADPDAGFELVCDGVTAVETSPAAFPADFGAFFADEEA